MTGLERSLRARARARIMDSGGQRHRPVLPAPEKPTCNARTRRGTPCQCKKLYPSGRCRFHGGLSTGPKTAAGKRTCAMNLPRVRNKKARQAEARLGRFQATGSARVPLRASPSATERGENK